MLKLLEFGGEKGYKYWHISLVHGKRPRRDQLVADPAHVGA